MKRALAFTLAFVVAASVLAQPRPSPTPGAKRKKAEQEAEKEEKPAEETKSVPGKPNYYVMSPLLGTWETRDGRRLVIQQGGAYTLSGTESDSGALIAKVGMISRRSPTSGDRWVDGTFTFRTLSELVMEGAFPGEWHRVK